MISHVLANDLYDLYGELLSPRQRQVLALYFQEDWSLFEICEELDVSRSAVHDALRKGVDAMTHFEQTLRLHEKNEALRVLMEKHPELAGDIEPILAL